MISSFQDICKNLIWDVFWEDFSPVVTVWVEPEGSLLERKIFPEYNLDKIVSHQKLSWEYVFSSQKGSCSLKNIEKVRMAQLRTKFDR